MSDTEAPKNCLIYWRNLIDGTEGNGVNPVTREYGEHLVNILNAYYIHLIHHWVVEIGEVE